MENLLDKCELAKLHKDIVDMGWIRTHRKETGGIGRTYEDLLGIKENNENKPDFKSIEIKTHRKKSNSGIHLFTCTPKPIKNPAIYLARQYGDYSKYKSFNLKITTNKHITYKQCGYYFKLRNDRKREMLYIGVYDENIELMDELYFPYHDRLGEIEEDCYGYWLSCPSVGFYPGGFCLKIVDYIGSVYWASYSEYMYGGLGLRPVVYLPSSIEGHQDATGVWNLD